MKFITEYSDDQWVVDKLVEHESCENIYIERLNDEIMLCCGDCHDVVLNYFKVGALD